MDTRSRRSRSGLTAGTRSFSGRARCLRGPRSDPAKPVKTTETRPRTTVRSEARPLRALRFQGACLALPSASVGPRTHRGTAYASGRGPASAIQPRCGLPLDPSVSVTIAGTRAKSVPQPINSYHRNELIGGSCDRERRGPDLGPRAVVSGLLGLTAIFVVVLALGFLFSAPARAERAPTLSTDKPDYAPEQIVTIYGAGFLSDANVTVAVTRPDNTTNTWNVTSDAAGAFVTTYQLDGIQGNYTVVATDGTSTV